MRNRQTLAKHACTPDTRDGQEILTLSIVDREQLKRLLERIWDSGEFLSDYGVRSLSKYHSEHPFAFGSSVVRYGPAEEAIKLKGGNSNWRGPIWFLTAYLIVESLRKYSKGFGLDFGLEGPDGRITNTRQMAEEIAKRHDQHS